MVYRLPRARRQGFSLLETLVALTLIGVALLLTMALLAQHPWVSRRLDAHLEAIHVLDQTHEAVRAGLSIPSSGSATVDWQTFDPPPSVTVAENLRVVLEVEATGTPHLVHLTLRARYSVRGGSFERTVETLVRHRG